MPDPSRPLIEKGRILAYRLFDVASEITLSKLTTPPSFGRVVERRAGAKFVNRPSVIQMPHFEFDFGRRDLLVNRRSFSCDTLIKVRDFGVISVVFAIEIPPHTPWEELVEIAAGLDKDHELDRLGESLCIEALARIHDALIGPTESKLSEEYVIYCIDEFAGAAHPLELIESVNAPALLWAECDYRLSDQSMRSARENTFQYAENDLAIVEWNAALVIDPSGSRDIPDVLEFALSHLLETRYYDELLTSRLRELYDQINVAKQRMFGGRFDRVYRESSVRFIEFTEFTERVENAFKVVGDFYLAKVYRAATREFRIQDWQTSVTRKIGMLGQVSSLLQGEVSTRKGHLLEIVIILLIFYEVLMAIFR